MSENHKNSPVLTSILTDWQTHGVRHQTLTYADPATGHTQHYDRVTQMTLDSNEAMGVIVVCRDTKGRLLLVDELRHAVNAIVTTFPTGIIEPDETPLRAAVRVLLEKTGLQATSVQCHAVDWAYPVVVDNQVYVVTATAEGDPVPHGDAWDSCGPFWLSPEEIPSLLNNGEWLDARLRLFLMGASK